MRDVTIQLTDTQEKFLKEFASKHFPGSKENLCTDMPIHIVQTARKNYYPIDFAYDHLTDFETIIWNHSICEECTFDELLEILEDKLVENNEDTNIIPYQSALNTEINDILITNELEYFESYGLDVSDYEFIAVAYEYDDVAYFFIKDEAKRYIEYQGHNLRKPRVYSKGPGYSNYGDYRHFYKLLYDLGVKLNNEEISNKEE